jgi:hypothetical protein
VNILAASGAVHLANARFSDETHYLIEPTAHSAAIMNHLAQGVWESYANLGGSKDQIRRTTRISPTEILVEMLNRNNREEVLATYSATINLATNGAIDNVVEIFTAPSTVTDVGFVSMTKITRFLPDGVIEEEIF